MFFQMLEETLAKHFSDEAEDTKVEHIDLDCSSWEESVFTSFTDSTKNERSVEFDLNVKIYM